jgi:flagellar motor switch protein FliM
MSNVAPSQEAGDISQRLRSAAEIDPARLPRLVQMSESWAESATIRLASVAAERPALSFSEVELDTPPEPHNDGDSGELAAMLSSPRFQGPGYAVVTRSLVEALISTFFAAEPSPDKVLTREPTELDRGIVMLALDAIVEAAGEIFAPLARLELRRGDLVDQAELATRLEDGPSRFVQFRFELRVRGLTAPLTVAFPEDFIAPHRRFLSQSPADKPVDREETWSEAIKASFSQSDLRIDALLAKKKVPLSKIAAFKVGETIPLDVDITSLIAIACEDRPLFRAKVGRSRDAFVISVEERIDPAQEFIDDILPD